ncbi:MAG: translation initiation factor IF-3 [Planctomycetes bacterium]|nr:translation initiation factor IF-3 [Planctomycetota bacterium]
MIRIRQVRLIDDAGAMAGVVDTEVARQMAYEKGLDLVEVSPDARPPVCKIMDYGKFLYTLKKKEHESKRKQHKVEIKEIRLRPKIAEHDVSYKAKQARDFLLDGDQVQVTMLFRGREMSHMDVARVVMDAFIVKLADISKVDRPPKMEGRRLSLLLRSTAPPKPADAKKHADEKHRDDKDNDDHADDPTDDRDPKQPSKPNDAAPAASGESVAKQHQDHPTAQKIEPVKAAGAPGAPSTNAPPAT